MTDTLRDKFWEIRWELDLSSSFATLPTGMQKSTTSVGGPSGKSLKSMPMSARSASSGASFFRKRKLEMSMTKEKESATHVGNSTIPMDISPTPENATETQPIDIGAAETRKETGESDVVMTDIVPEMMVIKR